MARRRRNSSTSSLLQRALRHRPHQRFQGSHERLAPVEQQVRPQRYDLVLQGDVAPACRTRTRIDLGKTGCRASGVGVGPQQAAGPSRPRPHAPSAIGKTGCS
eukprot:5574675-Alexandrium_andersonii.AAC.1